MTLSLLLDVVGVKKYRSRLILEGESDIVRVVINKKCGISRYDLE